MDSLGLVLAITSAFLLASNKLAIRKSLLKMDESFAAFIATILAIPIFGLPILLYGIDLRHLPLAVIGVFAVAGILNYSIGRYCIWKSISTIGANRGNVMASSQVVYAVSIAILILGQSVSLTQGLGITLVMFSILLISLQGFGGHHLTKHQLRVGTLYGIAGGFCWGLSQVLMQIGISLFENATAATFITFLAAVPGLVLILFVASKYSVVEGGIFRFDKYSFALIIIAALLGNFGLFFRYLSLQSIPLTIVSTINGTNPMMTLVLSYFLIRKLENINKRTVVGLLMSVTGVLLLYF